MPVLTVASVEKYAPAAKRREIRDVRAPGLHLIIQPKPSGAKSWAMRFRRLDGKSAKLTLGSVDLSERETADEPTLGGALTLRQARELANRIDRERARGIDVVAQYKTAKTRERAAVAERAANSFAASAREFFVDHRTKWHARPRRWRGDARLLGLRWPRDADPAKVEPEVIAGSLVATWADKPVAEIDAHDVHTAIDVSRRSGVPGLARHNKGVSEARGRKMHAALSILFRWLQQRRRVLANPTAGVWHPGAPPARDRTLSDDEIRTFWLACDKVGEPYGAAGKLLLLLGARLNEVVGMRRDEVGHDGLWLIPKERTKNHRLHTVPLPPLAVRIIDSVPKIDGSPFVFTLDGKAPVTSFGRAKARIDAHMGKVPAFVLHDLRRSCASGMQRLGISDAVIERALNHVSGVFRGVAGTYQRDPLTPQVGEALLRWSRHIEGLVASAPAKVTKLADKARGRRRAKA